LTALSGLYLLVERNPGGSTHRVTFFWDESGVSTSLEEVAGANLDAAAEEVADVRAGVFARDLRRFVHVLRFDDKKHTDRLVRSRVRATRDGRSILAGATVRAVCGNASDACANRRPLLRSASSCGLQASSSAARSSGFNASNIVWSQ